MTEWNAATVEKQQPVISISPKGNGVRIYATIMPNEEKIRLLRLALEYLEKPR